MAEAEQTPPKLFKVVLVGAPAVGKTCLLSRYANNEFNEDHSPTNGVEFLTKSVFAGGQAVRMQLWDMGGVDGPKPPAISEQMVFRGADGFMIVYDVTNKKSFYTGVSNAKRIAANYPTPKGETPAILLLGNMVDRGDGRREVDTDDSDTAATDCEFGFMEVSALSALNVEHAFEKMALMLVTAILDV